MFLEKTSKKVKGYVEIQVFGFFIERFLNLAMNSDINIWNVQKKDDATAIIHTDMNGYKKLAPIASKTSCKITIIKKAGIPFYALKHKKRPTFPILFLLIAVGVYIYQLHIWHINIVGEFSFPIEEIKQELEKENIRIGARKSSLDTSYIKNNIYMRRHDIAWIGISFKGTSCVVEIVEANLKPEENELDKVPCNIVADKDGMIYSINTLEGTPLVISGDIVKSGDVLISGIVSSEWSPTRYVNAKGDIKIKKWYTKKEIIQLERDIVSHTGRVENEYTLEIQNYKINLGNSGTNLEKYDTIETENNLNLFGLVELPIKLKKKSYRELDVQTVKYTEDQAVESTIKEMENKLRKSISNDGKIINKDIKKSRNENNITIIITIECIEKVGVKTKLKE